MLNCKVGEFVVRSCVPHQKPVSKFNSQNVNDTHKHIAEAHQRNLQPSFTLLEMQDPLRKMIVHILCF